MERFSRVKFLEIIAIGGTDTRYGHTYNIIFEGKNFKVQQRSAKTAKILLLENF